MERAEAMVRMVLRKFHLPSKAARCKLISEAEADDNAKTSSDSFKGTLPAMVTPNTPMI
jgi:hypothetical protein